MNFPPRLFQIRRGEHAGICGDDHLGALDPVAGLELAHDRHDRAGLGLVALETADLQWVWGPWSRPNERPEP
jgi:hypothetical protein